MSDTKPYGVNDNSYQSAGGFDGLTHLVDAFYAHMDTAQDSRVIRDMHPKDLSLSRDKLRDFLSGWLGGPRLYAENYGPISIPRSHAHLTIGEAERDMWINCMQKAVDQQPYENSFKKYLIEQLNVPAERIRIACSTNR